MKFRIEEDSLGKVRVPRNALWGAQTQRAIDNFPISGISMNFPFTNTFISMLGYVKDAAARANKNLKLLEVKKESFLEPLKRYGKINMVKSFQLTFFKLVLEQVQI